RNVTGVQTCALPISHWWPWLVTGDTLSHVGLLLAILLLVLFTILNWFGVLLLARLTNLITLFKIAVPLITIALMVASGFHPATKIGRASCRDRQDFN